MSIQFREYIDKNTSRGTIVLVSSDTSETIGSVSFNKDVISYIESTERRRGWGSIILNKAESYIKSQGYRYIYLTPLKEVEQFYIKNGYRKMTIFDNIWYLRFNGMMKKI